MIYNAEAKYAVFNIEVGTVGFESESIAFGLFLKVEGKTILYKILSNGDMKIIARKISPKVLQE